MPDPLRLALIGCGAQGRTHIGCLNQIEPDLVRIEAICDLSEQTLEEVGGLVPDARRETDYRQLLDAIELDLAIVATMPHTHAEICCAALERNVHVLCEKPFAMDEEQVRLILLTAADNRKEVQLGTNMRYMPRPRYLRDLVASGDIGTPMQCLVRGSQANPPLLGPHYNVAANSGGVLASTTLHTLDLCMWAAGSPSPVSVSASTRTQFPTKRGAGSPPELIERYDAEDLLAALVRFDDGSAFLIDGNWCEDVQPSSRGFEIVASGGTVGTNPFFVRRIENGEPVDATPEIDEDDWNRSIRDQDLDVVTRLAEGRSLDIQDDSQLLNLQRVIDGCYESARLGREITL